MTKMFDDLSDKEIADFVRKTAEFMSKDVDRATAYISMSGAIAGLRDMLDNGGAVRRQTVYDIKLNGKNIGDIVFIIRRPRWYDSVANVWRYFVYYTTIGFKVFKNGRNCVVTDGDKIVEISERIDVNNTGPFKKGDSE